MKRLIPLVMSLIAMILIFALGRTVEGTTAKAAACFITTALYLVSYQYQWSGDNAFMRGKSDLFVAGLWMFNGVLQTFILFSLKAYS